MDREKLREAGICYEKGLERFLDDSALYEEMLMSFLEDNAFDAAKAAREREDYEALFEACHALKGVVGSLDMTELFSTSSALTEYLRNNHQPDRDITAALFSEMEAAYRRVIAGIQEASR